MLIRVGELAGGTFGFELHDVIANDEHAVAIVTTTAERAGKQRLNNKIVQVHQIRDGKASEVWTYQYDLYAAEEFFS